MRKLKVLFLLNCMHARMDGIELFFVALPSFPQRREEVGHPTDRPTEHAILMDFFDQ